MTLSYIDAIFHREHAENKNGSDTKGRTAGDRMSWPGSTTAGRMFQYQWKRTDPDSHYDFAAYDGKQNIGRIYREDRNLKSGQWFWTMTAMIPGRTGVVCQGYLPTKDQAATQVELVYTVLKARAEAEAECNDGNVIPSDD